MRLMPILVSILLIATSLVSAAEISCTFLTQGQVLHPAMSHSSVIDLQQLLNTDRDTQVSLSGPGSPGNETSTYGQRTFSAVKRFQEKYAPEILAPLGLTQGTGFFGPATRKKLLSICKEGTPTTSQNNSLTPSATSSVSTAPVSNPAQVPSPIPNPVISPTNSVYVASFSGKGYYVDSLNGNDANSGTELKPWKTLSKASTAVLMSGDALLLKCGSTWREKPLFRASFAPQGGVLLAAYGTCDGTHYPTIKGSDNITSSWIKDSTNSNPIYVASFATAPAQVFSNGEKLIKARYPNYGGIGHEYNILGQVNSSSSVVLSDADKNSLSGRDMSGASIYIRIEPWYIDALKVSGYDSNSGALTLNKNVTYTAERGDGYVLEDKKWMLDSPGEWYYDDAAQKLYVWLPDNSNPSSSLIEASVRIESIIVMGVSGLRIEHINFEQTSGIGVYIQNSKSIEIADILGKDDRNNNIIVENGSNIIIRNSSFSGASSEAVRIFGGSDNTVRDSTVHNVGVSGMPDNSYAAIEMDSVNGLVHNNKVDNTAYIGIRFTNKEGTKISQNTITNVCLRLSDCAGIYTWNGNLNNSPKIGALVEKNIVTGASVNIEGSTARVAAGIYLDNLTTHVRVLNNTTSNVSMGIMLNETNNITLSDNKI